MFSTVVWNQKMLCLSSRDAVVKRLRLLPCYRTFCPSSTNSGTAIHERRPILLVGCGQFAGVSKLEARQPGLLLLHIIGNNSQCQQFTARRHFALGKHWLAKRQRNGWQNSGNSPYYILGVVVIMAGLSFAFIPFFRMLCETSNFGGVAQIAESLDRITTMERVEDRLIRVQFGADMPSSMQWKFKPLQDEIYVNPGETALAFFTAKNPTERPIVGISTYNLVPFQAAYYFNKIQCFCFDEQILNPGEEVDLPVFFFIDPDYVNDPTLERMDHLLLNYTFFESDSDLTLPSPFDPRPPSANQVQQLKPTIIGQQQKQKPVDEHQQGKEREKMEKQQPPLSTPTAAAAGTTMTLQRQ